MNKAKTFKCFSFDQVFDENACQEAIFRRTRADFLIQQILTGFHATIFAYGQTGSGKTFTMEGYKYARTGLKDNLVPQIDRKASSLLSKTSNIATD